MDRMGLRLSGPSLTHKINADILSDGIVKGAVQIPGDGQPIILMADHQTTGGYTKIASVISTDLPALTRLAAHRVSASQLSVRQKQNSLLVKRQPCSAKFCPWSIIESTVNWTKTANHLIMTKSEIVSARNSIQDIR